MISKIIFFSLFLLSLALSFGGEKVDGKRATITVVYDNQPYREDLVTSWGFSALIKVDGQNILFDTGGEGKILIKNMRKLNIPPKGIELVVLSHNHWDHTGGLLELIREGARPKVILLKSFPDKFKEEMRRFVKIEEITGPREIAPGVWTTGEMGSTIIEQSLIIKTDRGLIVITGCAHPGIASIVAKAKELLGGPIYLVMGGFHLRGSSEKEILEIAKEFKKLGVINLAPSHCTGDTALSIFSREFGKHLLNSGVGAQFIVEDENGDKTETDRNHPFTLQKPG